MTDKVERYKALCAKLIRNPDDPQALIDQFALVSEVKKYRRHYVSLAKRAYQIEPDNISCVFNYAGALNRVGDFDLALKLYLKCEKMADEEWKSHILHHIGVSYRSLGENFKAIKYYDAAIAANPEPIYKKDRALALMATGRLKEGLEAFEIRREVAKERVRRNKGELLVSQQKLPEGVVHWEGQDLTGKTVVVYHEEGSGDFMMFCRFIPKLREKGVAKILLCGPIPDLLDIVCDNMAIDGVVPLSGPFECDYVIGSMSLP
jgi:tetratricopeptide (TPR) repeat protein